ncbi:MAG: endolytic transglycosylase MltG [Erysipelotrichia bacterium]|nr:endolytic transglycosylase MltG [Erysipelotrichia bacterium]
MVKNKKNKTKVILIVILAFLIAVSSGFAFVYKTYLNGLKPTSEVSESTAFVVDEGITMDELINKLYEEGFIKDVKVAKVYVKLNKINDYYAGNFILDKNMGVKIIFDTLSDVNKAYRDEVSVTIPDGSWAKDAAAYIAEKTNLTAEEILHKWNEVDYIYKLIDKYEFLTEDVFKSEHCYLEGYIYPETYSFYTNTTVEQVTEKILDHQNVIYQKYKEQIANSGFTVHEIYTLASVILFEVSNEEDMYLVSSVFHNRLKDGWKLQSSVTICYALYNYDSWIDCETNPHIDSAYNTYRVEGLPIGPVSNTNEMALKATLNPAKSNYYFFVNNIRTGKAYFAETYEQHQRNVRKHLN